MSPSPNTRNGSEAVADPQAEAALFAAAITCSDRGSRLDIDGGGSQLPPGPARRSYIRGRAGTKREPRAGSTGPN